MGRNYPDRKLRMKTQWNVTLYLVGYNEKGYETGITIVGKTG